MLEKRALEEEIITEKEKMVLRSIFSRLTADKINPKVWKFILHFQNQYDICSHLT